MRSITMTAPPAVSNVASRTTVSSRSVGGARVASPSGAMSRRPIAGVPGRAAKPAGDRLAAPFATRDRYVNVYHHPAGAGGPKRGVIRPARLAYPAVEEAIDDLAEGVLGTGGQVVLADRVPTAPGLAAVFRY